MEGGKMSVPESVKIELKGVIDCQSAETIAARIRAAIQNEIPCIIIEFTPGVVISSAEFLAFLTSTARYMKRNKQKLTIRGATGKNKTLLNISKLAMYAEIEHVK
jgi:anti-anti-sigma regulatory factor